MNGKCTTCKKSFKHEQVVQRPHDRTDVICCSDACCKKFDAKRVQKEAFPKWSKYRYSAKKFSSPGCHIDKTTITMKDSPPVVTLGVRLPGKVSVDELKGFSGEDVTVTITRNKFEAIKERAKPKTAKEKAEAKARTKAKAKGVRNPTAKKTAKPPKTNKKD